jgi:hypothetical protein
MQLGREAGHPEIVGRAHEMQAWFALTQGRYPGVLRAARAGQHTAPNGSAAVQLAGQEAKALARTGDIAGVRATLDRGAALLADLPAPDRPDNHFVVDPAKWDFYAWTPTASPVRTSWPRTTPKRYCVWASAPCG